MELAKAKEESSPDHSTGGLEEALPPSTQDDHCIRRLLYAKSPKFDGDIATSHPKFDRAIATSHTIVREELKMVKEAIKKLQGKLNQEQ